MNSEMFCSLLPHGSAVRKVTPGSVWSALSGLIPGRIFWISAPDTCDTARVVVPVTTMSPAGASAAAVACAVAAVVVVASAPAGAGASAVVGPGACVTCATAGAPDISASTETPIRNRLLVTPVIDTLPPARCRPAASMAPRRQIAVRPVTLM
ncbi:MAG: hypothetical protein ACRYFW_17005 [Janthinobacterium lividum]